MKPLGPELQKSWPGWCVWSPLKHVSGSAVPLLDTTCVRGRKGMGFIFSYHVAFRASLIAQLVKNPPAMQETPV